MPDGSFTPESPERKIGKTADLACGYMGGAGAIEKFAPGVFDEAKREQIKNEWRAAHPNIKNFWYEIDRAAWAAVQNRGSIVRCGPVAFRCVGAFLFLKLPSGRKLAYPVARTKLIDPQRGVVLFTDNAAGRWRDCRDGRGAYGGIWTENIVQAISRDLLADAMLTDRSGRLSDRVARARRDRRRSAGRFRQHRRIHPHHDSRAVLGADAADRSESVGRSAI